VGDAGCRWTTDGDFYRWMFRDLGTVNVRDPAKAVNVAIRKMKQRRNGLIGTGSMLFI
jgi:hypothetical protein